MAVDRLSRGAIWAEQRSRAARRRHWLTAAALLLVGTCGVKDCYVHEVRDFTPLQQGSAFGTATVSLSGNLARTEGGKRSIRGNPYRLFVGLERAHPGVVRIEVVSLTLRGREDGKAISFSRAATRSPNDPGSYIMIEGVNLRYQDYSVSGTLRMHTTRGAHDVPLGGTLRRSFSRSRESRFMDAFMSV
jgi:hypothetical protein